MAPDISEATPVQAGVARVFDDAAGYYRELRWDKNRLTRFERWITQTTLEEELGDRRVGDALELGCGPGTWSGLLAARAERVLAVDLSSAMLAQARRAYAGNPHIEFRQADVAEFDGTSRKFDKILSVRVLEYVPEW